jgi:hypothetical protein
MPERKVTAKSASQSLDRLEQCTGVERDADCSNQDVEQHNLRSEPATIETIPITCLALGRHARTQMVLSEASEFASDFLFMEWDKMPLDGFSCSMS